MSLSKKGLLQPFFRYLISFIGSIIDAFAYSAFLIPNKLNLGGLAGIAIIFYHLYKIPVGFLYIMLNIPIFILAYNKINKKVLLKTAFTILINAFFMDYFVKLLNGKPISSNLLIAVIYGGVISGIGIGLVFKSKGSLGGTDLLSQVVFSYTHFSYGQIVFFVDASVIIATSIVFKDPNLAFFPLISLFIVGKVIDLVQEGFSNAKFALVITENETELIKYIIEEMGRGVTILEGYGGFTSKGKKIMICAFQRSQTTSFKENIKFIEPSAFILIGSLDEVLGEGFKSGF
jgi:uncharacterized membrane-anchored protein YitT (DUF2179 family)